MVKASALRAADLGSIPAFPRGTFSGSSHTSDLNCITLVAALPGVVGTALELVGPVSVYCDWMR